MSEVSNGIFFNELLKNISLSNNNNSHVLACDLVDIMANIYYYDITTRRSSEGINFKISVPVYNIELWENAKSTIIKLVNWVSGGDIDLKFYYSEKDIEFETFIPGVNNNGAEIVSLFSGGLDSFAGLYYNYRNEELSNYIGYINKGEEKTKQDDLKPFYQDIFPDSIIHLVEKLDVSKVHYTQSTRSLLYLSLAVAKCVENDGNEVRMFENGILSLNPPLNGRFTTKTTHPKTVYLFNKILSEIYDGLTINNPFETKTKGEVLKSFEDNLAFKEQIKNTFTCGKSRQSKHNNHAGQCGICIPCLLRKISITSCDFEEYDVNYHYEYGFDPNILSEYLYHEYKSNLDYFELYSKKIEDENINDEMSFRTKYSTQENVEEKYKLMFQNFLIEYRKFRDKYVSL